VLKPSPTPRPTLFILVLQLPSLNSSVLVLINNFQATIQRKKLTTTTYATICDFVDFGLFFCLVLRRVADSWSWEGNHELFLELGGYWTTSWWISWVSYGDGKYGRWCLVLGGSCCRPRRRRIITSFYYWIRLYSMEMLRLGADSRSDAYTGRQTEWARQRKDQ